MSSVTVNDINAAIAAVADSFDSAPSEPVSGNGAAIDWPGRYRVRLQSRNKKDGSMCWPSIIKDPKGRLVYKIIFEQVDSHKDSPKGATIYDNVYLTPAEAEATKEKIDNVVKYAKPKLAAISGDKNITMKEVFEKGTNSYDSSGNLIKQHSFNHEYMIDVTMSVSPTNGQMRAQVNGIELAKPGDVTFVEPRVDMNAPAASPTPAYSAIEPGDANAGKAIVDDGLPF